MEPRIAALVGILAVSCHNSEPMVLPQSSVQAKAVILMVSNPSSGARFLYASELDPEPSLPPFSLTEGSEVHLVLYTHTLAELALAAGVFELAGPSDPTRPFPKGDAIFTAVASSGRLGAWASAEDVEALRDARLPEAPFEPCLSAGGCFETEANLASRVCSLDCAARSEPAPAAGVDPPAAVRQAPCPAEWREEEDEGAVVCLPPDRAPPCAAGEVQWIDAESCAEWAPCPTAEWSELLPAGRPVIYVRAGAIGGDGSASAPVGTIAEALARASASAVIALGAGTFAEALNVPSGVEVIGRCPAQTLLAPPGDPSITVSAPGAALRGVGLRRARISISNGPVELSRIDLDEMSSVVANGGVAVIRDLASRAGGSAVFVTGTASVTIQRAAFVNGETAVSVMGSEAFASVEDAVVVGVSSAASSSMLVTDSARLVLERVGFVDAAASAVNADRSAVARLNAVFVRGGTSPRLEIGPLSAARGAQIQARNVTLQATPGTGISSFGAQVSLTDVVVRDPRGSSGVFVDRGILDATRLAVLRARGRAIDVVGEGAVLRIDDLFIRDTSRSNQLPVATSGVAITARSGAALSLDRVDIARSGTQGILMFGTGPAGAPGATTGTLRHVKIADTSASELGGGDAVFFSEGVGSLRFSHVRLQESARFGINATLGAQATVSDLVVDGAFMGVRTEQTTSLGLNRALILRTRATGLCVRGESDVSAQDVRVTGAMGVDVSDPELPCAFGVPSLGDGISVSNLAHLTLTRFAASQNAGVGLVVRAPRSVLALDGVIEGNSTGVQLAPGVSPEDVLLRTRVHGNDVALDLQ